MPVFKHGSFVSSVVVISVVVSSVVVGCGVVNFVVVSFVVVVIVDGLSIASSALTGIARGGAVNTSTDIGDGAAGKFAAQPVRVNVVNVVVRVVFGAIQLSESANSLSAV